MPGSREPWSTHRALPGLWSHPTAQPAALARAIAPVKEKAFLDTPC